MKKTEKLAFVAIAAPLFFGGLLSVAYAQEPAAPVKDVVFNVTVGKLDCSKGVAQSIVKFENTPTEGGYYEITGKRIDENNIVLDREVPLPSGTYFWSGMPQSGYATTSVSSGMFTIDECPKVAAPMKKTEAPLIQETKNREVTASESLKKEITSGSITSPLEKKVIQNEPSSESSTGSQKTIFAILLLFIAVIVVYVKKEKRDVVSK